MKKNWKRAPALLLCAVSLILTVSAAGSRETVYFMAVNDTPLELSASTMPVRVGSTLYVPYFMFSANSTGVNLGVYAAYNTARGQLLVYSSRRQLTFDLVENLAYDGDGTVYSSRAMVRGSTVYLPVALVCSVFGDIISYSTPSTQYGILVRVKSASAVLDDRAFIAAASTRMSSMLARYLEETAASSSAAPSAAPTPSAAPSSPADPTPTPSQAITGGGARVYPAFALTAPDGADPVTGTLAALDALERAGVQGLFFLTAEDFTARDDLVRRIVGQGHLVGVRLTGEDADAAMAELERAADALAAVARCRPCAVLGERLDGDGLDALAAAGYPCWRTTVDGRALEGTAAARAKALVEELAVGADARSYVLLDAGAGATLARVLDELAEADFRLRTPLPTEI